MNSIIVNTGKVEVMFVPVQDSVNEFCVLSDVYKGKIKQFLYLKDPLKKLKIWKMQNDV